MLDTYEEREDLTLEQLKIYPMKTLALEKRQDSASPWKAYDPSMMVLKLVFWKPNLVSTVDESLQTRV